MTVEVVVLSTYALVLLGTAQGLLALGRRSTSPWASRTLTGHLRATGARPEPLTSDDWPHTDVSRLYAGMALVAALAGSALSVGSLSLGAHGAVLALPLTAFGLSTLSALRVALALRHPTHLAPGHRVQLDGGAERPAP